MSLLDDKTVEGWENERTIKRKRKLHERLWLERMSLRDDSNKCLTAVRAFVTSAWVVVCHSDNWQALGICPYGERIPIHNTLCNCLLQFHHTPTSSIHAVFFLFSCHSFFPQVAWIFGTLPETLPYELTPPPPGWDNFLCHSRRLAASRTSCSATSVSSLLRRCESKLHFN